MIRFILPSQVQDRFCDLDEGGDEAGFEGVPDPLVDHVVRARELRLGSIQMKDESQTQHNIANRAPNQPNTNARDDIPRPCIGGLSNEDSGPDAASELGEGEEED